MEVVVTEYIRQENADMHTVNCITKMKILVLLLLGAVVAQAKNERLQVYECRAFSEPFYTGIYHDFYEAVPYLSSYDFDNTIASVQVTGVWLFYNHEAYNTNEPGLVYSTWGIGRYDPLSDSIQDQVSSLRYAGSQLELNENGYNLYHGTYFTGKDLYETNDIPDLSHYNQDVNSIIIIGTGFWTFCEGPYYIGNCVCLIANQHDENSYQQLDVGFYTTIQEFPVGLSQVMSVYRGCGGGGGGKDD